LSKGIFENTDGLCKSEAQIDYAITCFIFSGLPFFLKQQLAMQLCGQLAILHESAGCAIQSIV
jgi:hypothetical protein